MISFPEGICPLCSRVLAPELLRNHIVFEDPRMRQSTIQVIQAYHPSWVEDHGACEPCWRSYRDAVQMVAVMKSARRQTAAGCWNPVPLAAEDGQDQIGPQDAC